jgi:hypothetical protein
MGQIIINIAITTLMFQDGRRPDSLGSVLAKRSFRKTTLALLI